MILFQIFVSDIKFFNRGCQSWTIFYLTSNFFFEYYALAKNFRPSQSKQPNFDYPQMHKISKNILHLSFLHLYAKIWIDLMLSRSGEESDADVMEESLLHGNS